MDNKNKFKVSVFLYILLIVFSTRAFSETIKIIHAESYRPYSFIDEDGNSNGMLIDLWNLWSEKAGADIEFLHNDFPHCIDMTVNSKTDIIAGLFFTNERSTKLDYSMPLIKLNAVLFIRKESKISNISDINTGIAIVKGDASIEYMKTYHPELKILKYDNYNILREDVLENKFDAFIYDIPTSALNINNNIPSGYKILKILYSESLRAGVKKGNKKLLVLINKGLKKITKSERDDFYIKWKLFTPEQLRDSFKRIIINLLIVFVVLIFIISGLFLYRHRKKNNILENSDNMDIRDLIASGENDDLEFKSSLRWDYRNEVVNKELEMVIAKTISAFLNSAGGSLIIGVDDDGKILGLANDYNTFSKKKNSDGFLLKLIDLINSSFGKKYHSFITIAIHEVDGLDICLVQVSHSDHPVFLKKKNQEEFYIRASASSLPLGIRETHEYINSHWQKK